MNYLWLSEEQGQMICTYAQAELPREACGLLAGRGGRVQRVIPIANVSRNPTQHYYMDAVALGRHLPQIERESLTLLGFYHSHTTGEPIPSMTDIREAAYPDAIHLIVGLKHEKPRLAAWSIRDERVLPIPLHIGPNPPDIVDNHLTLAQITAIITCAIIAFGLMLYISLTLLPPAPPLP
jgi:proteasome lid subunit RPN8/RPN11